MFKRWLPALSVAVWLLACVVILAVQSNAIRKLRDDNETLRAAALQSVFVTSASPKDELTKLRADSEEVARLRAEISQLQEQLKELQVLRTDNQRLLAEASALNAASPQPQDDFFAQAAAKEEAARCVNNLKQVGLAARIWANDHGDVFPRVFSEFETELGTSKILFCPGGQGKVQYQIVSPGISEEDPNVVFVRCPRHPHVGLVDGSVQMIGNRRLVVRPDGKTVIGD